MTILSKDKKGNTLLCEVCFLRVKILQQIAFESLTKEEKKGIIKNGENKFVR